MNKVSIVGNLTKDPETRYTTGDKATAITRFSVAMQRRFKRDGDEQTADFVNCVAFGKTGEFVEKYFKKGKAIGIVGRLQSGSYVNKDGNKVYTLDVIAEEVEFVGNKSDNDDSGYVQNNKGVDAETDDDLPFH